LDEDESTYVALDPGGAIVWTNAAWNRFAIANGGTEVLRRFRPGTSYFEGIAAPLRGFYQSLLLNALTTGEVVDHTYECSSADVFRRFHMRALPLDRKGLLLEHSLVVERPHDPADATARDVAYADGRGIVLQCSNCRRVRRRESAAWDWVPHWVRQAPAQTSHGLCNTCVSFYWGRRLTGGGA
jgi:hypothetical protein